MPTNMADENYRSRTLFVRNLTSQTTEDNLNSLFEDIGPIKQCFVVKDKESNTCKGYGYVKFALIEDAIKAKDTVTSLDGRKLNICFADYKKKKEKKKFGKRKRETEDSDDNDEEEKEEVKKVKVEKQTSKADSLKDSKYLKAKIVVLSGFTSAPTCDDIEQIVSRSHVKKVSKVVYPIDDRDVPTAFLKFKCVRDANRAIRRLKDETKTGCKLNAVQLSKEGAEGSQKTLKTYRLIVRNLSFQCEIPELESKFQKFGEISEVHLPKKPDGKKMGFGFIQFTSKESAESAMSAMNGVKIRGRPIAVDWSVAKRTFEKIKDTADSEDEGSYSGDSEEDKTDEQDSSEDDSDSSSDEGYSDESDSDDEASPPPSKKSKKQIVRKSDVDEGKTLFIRNVPFNCEVEDLQDVLADFGDITYCKLVIDPATQHPRGTAFVKFKTAEQAQECITKAEDPSKEGGIVLNDRPLKVSPALKREDVTEMKEKEKQKENTDKRNLFLVREGLIRPGTAAAEGLPKSDLVKRTKVEAEMRQKLKNPNIFVSPTRLCVQNLPLDVTDVILKSKMAEAASVKPTQITECRIMRDKQRVNTKGVGKSRGFGFVNFFQHEQALKALRESNNTDFNNKRLIVHFSLEDQRKVLIQQQRKERVKALKAEENQGARKEGENRKRRRGKKEKRNQDQDEVARSIYTGPKGLPSHSGPKVRHKARPGQVQGQKKKKKGNDSVQKRPINGNVEKGQAKKKEKPMKKKKGRNVHTDDFDKLVQSYKNKMTGSAANRGKWFD